ncbi:MAG: hypothetical protein ACTSWN_05415 [Promethearchaeota archaeon]
MMIDDDIAKVFIIPVELSRIACHPNRSKISTSIRKIDSALTCICNLYFGQTSKRT